MSKRTNPIDSDFAILDVKKGRSKLARHFATRPRLGGCPKEMRIPVVIKGYIDGIHGSDDGTSREFTVIVESAQVAASKARTA